ncbi:LIM-domain binding protein/SEUSS [Sesbania bispinosa]|nr:LIM-domain binding protein/SEUSS [Sesbania bispinosa]
MPREIRSPSGAMMLEYTKAVQECVYEQLRVVREGQLRIIFTQDLKIFSWEFCARRHEELLPRKLLHHSVINGELRSMAESQNSAIKIWRMPLRIMAKFNSPPQFQQRQREDDSPENLVAGRRSPEKEVTGRETGCGECGDQSNLRHKVNQLVQVAQKCQSTIAESGSDGVSQQDLQTNSNMVLTAGRQLAKSLELQSLNDLGFSKRYVRCLQAAMALTNYQSLVRQNSTNSSPGSLQRERPSFSNSNQSPSSAVQGAGTALIPGSMQNSPNHSQGSQGNQALDQKMIQQILQMSNNNGGVQPQSLAGPNANGNMAKSGLGFGGQTPAISGGSANVPGNNGPVSRSNSFKAASNSDSSAAGGNNGFNQRTSDMSQNLHLQDVVHNIAPEFTDNHFFNSDLDDNMGFDWKA